MHAASVHTLFSRLVLVAFLSYSGSLLAKPVYIGGYLGQTNSQDDGFFDQLSSEPDIDNTTTSYSISAGVMVYEGFSIEFEIGAHKQFLAESELSFSFEKLSIENTFARINLKHDFLISDSFGWYIKESLGVIKAKQSFTNATGLEEKTVNDNALFPAFAIGIQKGFTHNFHKFNVYAEWQYSGYDLESDNETYHIRHSSLGVGLQWVF